MNYLINSSQLSSLLKDFYTLTKMRIVVLDDEFREIASYPNRHSKYCEIIRKSDALKECIGCDKEACEICRKSKKLITYRCHAGMTEAVAPIMYDGIVVGYIMLGQVLQTQNRELAFREMIPHLKNCGIDIDAIKTLYFKKKSITSDAILAASKIMQACSGYLYLSRMIVINDDDIAARLDKYICNNLQTDLNAENLRKFLGISKSRLYEISAHSYGKGISEHIRGLRIEKAVSLLENTNQKINEIAALTGFTDYNYFTKVFKRYTGATPSSYRKRFKLAK